MAVRSLRGREVPPQLRDMAGWHTTRDTCLLRATVLTAELHGHATRSFVDVAACEESHSVSPCSRCSPMVTLEWNKSVEAVLAMCRASVHVARRSVASVEKVMASRDVEIGSIWGRSVYGIGITEKSENRGRGPAVDGRARFPCFHVLTSRSAHGGHGSALTPRTVRGPPP